MSLLTGDGICAKCCGLATMMCQRCHETYCSVDCQVLDWKDHKSKCHQMPNLVPLCTLQLRSGQNSSFDQRYHSDGAKDGSIHRTGSRNPPLRSKNDSEHRKPLLDEDDFVLKPKLVQNTESCSKGVIPKNANNTVMMPSLNTAAAETSWNGFFAPPQGKFFDAIVQWLKEESDTGAMWVTEMRYERQLEKLMIEINRCIKDSSSPLTEVKASTLVAAPLNEVFYRAVVLEADKVTQQATVRLIDYGNVLHLNFDQLRGSIPIMRNLNAYAFCVRLQCGRFPDDLQMGSVVTMRVLCADPLSLSGNTYFVELKPKSVPLDLPLDSLRGNIEMKLRKVFIGGHSALLQFAEMNTLDENMDTLLTSKDAVNFDFSVDQPPKEGDFVAACTSQGWRRACVLGYCLFNSTYLVYLIDGAGVDMCKQVKKIPEEFLTLPMRIVAISVTSTQQASLDESQLKAEGKLSLRALSCATTPTKGVQSLPCSLYSNGKKMMDVVVHTFVGNLKDLNVKCWTEDINDGSMVIITHVLTQAEVFISSASTVGYPNLFTSMATKCLPFNESDDVLKDEIILAALADSEIYFRAKVLTNTPPGSDPNTMLRVLDIDSGCCCTVPRKLLRKPNLFVRSCPVYVKKVKLIYLDRIPNPIEDNKAITTLHQCKLNCVEFIVNYVVGEPHTVNLFLKSDNQQSLSKQLLPLLFEKNATAQEIYGKDNVTSAEGTPLPPTPPGTPPKKDKPAVVYPASDFTHALLDQDIQGACAKVYTMDALDLMPIPVGDNILLSVLDGSSIGEGFITAAYAGNAKALQQMDFNLDKVKKYGRCPHRERNYEPKPLEICLGLFEEDGEWYRAMCVNVMDNGQFEIMFVDYGNVCKMTKESIMPITKDLMFATNANLCYVENLPSTLTKSEIINFVTATTLNPNIQCKVESKEKNIYHIIIHDIEEYFA